MAMVGLNCDDLPEANVWALGRGPATRGRLAKQSKHRVKNVEIPRLTSLAEAGDESCDDDGFHSTAGDWHCHACTFLNHGLLPRCEVCGADRHAAIPAASVVKGPELALDEQVALATLRSITEWPALPQVETDSWIECDVSSIASSWQDVGEPDIEDDDTDAVLVNDCSVPPAAPVQTHPPLWSAIVGSNASALLAPTAEVAVRPPCVRKSTFRPRARSTHEEDRDIDLDELDARRMFGTKRHHNRRR